MNLCADVTAFIENMVNEFEGRSGLRIEFDDMLAILVTDRVAILMAERETCETTKNGLAMVRMDQGRVVLGAKLFGLLFRHYTRIWSMAMGNWQRAIRHGQVGCR